MEGLVEDDVDYQAEDKAEHLAEDRVVGRGEQSRLSPEKQQTIRQRTTRLSDRRQTEFPGEDLI